MTSPRPNGTCAKCQQTRPVFEFSYVPAGWFEFTEVPLCARCHSDATEADERGDLDYIPTAADRELDAELAAQGKRL